MPTTQKAAFSDEISIDHLDDTMIFIPIAQKNVLEPHTQNCETITTWSSSFHTNKPRKVKMGSQLTRVGYGAIDKIGDGSRMYWYNYKMSPKTVLTMRPN